MAKVQLRGIKTAMKLLDYGCEMAYGNPSLAEEHGIQPNRELVDLHESAIDEQQLMHSSSRRSTSWGRNRIMALQNAFVTQIIVKAWWAVDAACLRLRDKQTRLDHRRGNTNPLASCNVPASSTQSSIRKAPRLASPIRPCIHAVRSR
jgi:hypothetical protein